MENTTTSTRYIPFDRALHSSNALFVKQCYCNTVNETELFISRLVNYIKSIVYCNVSEETNMNIGIIITANTINCVYSGHCSTTTAQCSLRSNYWRVSVTGWTDSSMATLIATPSTTGQIGLVNRLLLVILPSQ